MLSTREEIEICIAYLGDVKIKAICDYYLVSRMTVHRVLTKHQVKTERGKRALRQATEDPAGVPPVP